MLWIDSWSLNLKFSVCDLQRTILGKLSTFLHLEANSTLQCTVEMSVCSSEIDGDLFSGTIRSAYSSPASMHSSQQAMTGATLRAAHRGFLGLRCSGTFSLGSIDIPPCRLAHCTSAAQIRPAATAQQPAADSSYAERAAARKAARKQDTARPGQLQDDYSTSNRRPAAQPRTAKDAGRNLSSSRADQRTRAAEVKDEARSTGQPQGFASMSDTLLSDMRALLETSPAAGSAQGAELSNPPAQTRPAGKPANQAERASVPHGEASAAIGQQRRQSVSSVSLRQTGGEAASTSASGSFRQAQGRSSGGSLGQVAGDRLATPQPWSWQPPSSAEQVRTNNSSWGQVTRDSAAAPQPRTRLPPNRDEEQASLDWDCIGTGAVSGSTGLERKAGSTWGGQDRLERNAGSTWGSRDRPERSAGSTRGGQGRQPSGGKRP